MLHPLAIITSMFFIVSACNKQDQPAVGLSNAKIETTVLTENLNGPWEILWGNDAHIWFTEKGGNISRVDTATGKATLVFTIPDVVSRGEGGLLGMALHPDFSTTPQLFVVYDYNNGSDYKEKVVRYNYANGTLSSPLVILDNINAAGNHNCNWRWEARAD
ncbi:MAG: PQQ-dependent sugar dehydrogenase, partial [Ginsengibacter sp.]